LAAAYGAIANDGVLLQPTLIREIRSPPPGGSVLYRHRPEPVRRAVTPDVARRLRELLHGAAQRGTGEEGTLATFQIAAKTGTARRVVGGRYAPGEYTASFAAPATRRAVPDVTGLPLRDAVRTLHRRGFRVVLKGFGVTHHTWPAAGDSAAAGATVTLFGSRPSP